MEILERSATLTHVALSGRLDTAGVDRLETRFNAAVVAARKNAIVDLSAVEFLASMGLRMLLTAAKTLERSGVKLVLCAPRPLVETTIRNSGLDNLMPIAADVQAARASFASVGA